MLLVEPYKSELLPHCQFRTPALAQEPAETIYALFLAYKDENDFVGMDMARKFLQMGYTRSRRYANHQSGRKYDSVTQEVLPQEADWHTNDKAESARRLQARHPAPARGLHRAPGRHRGLGLMSSWLARHRFRQQTREPLQPETQAAFHRSQGQTVTLRDLAVGEPIEKRHLDRAALLAGERLHRRAHALALHPSRDLTPGIGD